ncbi:MAG: hypothetical protein QF733_09370 [Phycisphaerales bacterium]|jgi:hypothetical protein|nr:hypothetical protein [Phycisphaerales bacterium]
MNLSPSHMTLVADWAAADHLRCPSCKTHLGHLKAAACPHCGGAFHVALRGSSRGTAAAWTTGLVVLGIQVTIAAVPTLGTLYLWIGNQMGKGGLNLRHEWWWLLVCGFFVGVMALWMRARPALLTGTWWMAWLWTLLTALPILIVIGLIATG